MRISTTNPKTGEEFSCEASKEQRVEFSKLFTNLCSHEKITALVSISNGQTQLREFCRICGEGFGAAKKKDPSYNGTKVYDIDTIRKEAEYQRFLIRKNFIENLSEKNSISTSEFRREWGKYLQSPEWRALKKKVLKRAHNICEGCGDNQATEIHHLNYDRRFTEMMFDLVALCPTCHSLIHFEKNEKLRSANITDDESLPCCGCRYAGENDQKTWCLIYDVSGFYAANNPEYCNHGKNGFEGLK